MPIPASISELSTTPGSNPPSGADSPSVLDDHQRTAYAFIKTLSDAQVALTGNQTIAGVKTFSSTPVVPDDSFAFAKLQNVATATILGRSTSGTGDIEALTPAQAAAIVAAASETAPGVVELATDAEAQAGTDTSRAITAANLKAAQIQLGTPVTLTTQTAVDFTGIPSWAKRVTVMFTGFSTNGTSVPIIQLGDAGGVEASGYLGSACAVTSGSAAAALFTTGFGLINNQVATFVLNGSVTFTLMTGTTWIASGTSARSDAAGVQTTSGSKALSDALTQIRLTTVNGTDQFDAGSVNISWE